MPAPPRSRNRRDRRGNDPEDRMRRAREAQEAASQASRAVLDRVAARRDDVWRRAVEENRRRVRTMLAAPLLVGAVVCLLGVLLLVPLLIVGVVLLVGWILVASLSWRAANTGLARRLGGLRVEAAVEQGVLSPLAADRYGDVTESLCAALGLPLPSLRVLGDPALNIVSVGGKPENAVLVATSGLLERLERIELEAVLAHELMHVRRLDILSGGLSTALLHGGDLPIPQARRLATWLEGPDREVRADLGAVQATRYPPGLVSALEVVTTSSVRPASAGDRLLADTASQWLVPPTAGDPAGAGAAAVVAPHGAEFGAAERLDVLREL